ANDVSGQSTLERGVPEQLEHRHHDADASLHVCGATAVDCRPIITEHALKRIGVPARFIADWHDVEVAVHCNQWAGFRITDGSDDIRALWIPGGFDVTDVSFVKPALHELHDLVFVATHRRNRNQLLTDFDDRIPINLFYPCVHRHVVRLLQHVVRLHALLVSQFGVELAYNWASE